MAGAWQRYYPTPQRAAAASKRKPKKPKDVKVRHGGNRRRTVNAARRW